MPNCYLIIIDGLGVGAQEDAFMYGDEGANTLLHVIEQTSQILPNFQKLGLGNIIALKTVPKTDKSMAAYGKMREISGGKDSTTGHWEISGIQLDKPFPTYPYGFPKPMLEDFSKLIGVESILCNLPYSGTDVIRDYGEQHLKTGHPIVYTSADSVFQIATHNLVVPVKTLYEWCEIVRHKLCIGTHEVGRVIARPFSGEAGAFYRLTNERKDFSAPPPKHNVIQAAYDAGISTYSIGKVIDLFAGQGFTEYKKTENNNEGIQILIESMANTEDAFIFVNLIDTDQLYGHRLDPVGFANSLKEIDDAIPVILSNLGEDDLLIITGDHGNDPCSSSTDHSREFVPVLVYPKNKATKENLGIRKTFADVGASIADFFHLDFNSAGLSFLNLK